MSQVLKEGSKGLNLENWEVYHPNGKFMFVTGESKAEWYLNNRNKKTNKPLAIKIGEGKIKLQFQPNGTGYDGNDVFGLSPRIVQCVVTGKKNNLQRHHIVPYCYRTHLPEEYKSKNHHDVVLIRYDQHQKYEREADKFKDKIAEMFDVKTLKEYNIEYTKLLTNFHSKERLQTISRLFSLFNAYGKIPKDKIIENLNYVADHLGMDREQIFSYNYIQLYKLYAIIKDQYYDEFDELKNLNKLEYDHGYNVVQKLKTHQDIVDFVKMWRAHFIQTMKPKYMPKGWSVNYRVKVDI